MALPSTSRGWVLSSLLEEFADDSSVLSLASRNMSDAQMQEIKTSFGALVSLILDTITFTGSAFTFEDLPVAENAATLTTLTAKDCVNLAPGANDGPNPAWSTAVNVAAVDVSGNSWTAAQVDAFCNALDTLVQAGFGGSAAACTLDISGNTAPTAASTTARTNLAGYSPAWTITTD